MGALKVKDPTTGTWVYAGIPGPEGPQGPPGPTGPASTPLPPGGTTGQPLVKASDAADDLGWDAATLDVSHGINVRGINQGVVFPGGSRVYERDGYLVLRRGTANTQPKIHNNDASAQSDIITADGFARMTSALKFGTFLGKKVLLYESGATEFGLGIESGQMVLYVPAANKISFKGDSTTGDEWMKVENDKLTVFGEIIASGTNRGITFTGGARIYGWTDKALRLMEDAAGRQPQISDNDGSNVRDILDQKSVLNATTHNVTYQNGFTGTMDFRVNGAVVTMRIAGTKRTGDLSGNNAYKICDYPAGVPAPWGAQHIAGRVRGDGYVRDDDVAIEARAEGVFVIPYANTAIGWNDNRGIYAAATWAR